MQFIDSQLRRQSFLLDNLDSREKLAKVFELFPCDKDRAKLITMKHRGYPTLLHACFLPSQVSYLLSLLSDDEERVKVIFYQASEGYNSSVLDVYIHTPKHPALLKAVLQSFTSDEYRCKTITVVDSNGISALAYSDELPTIEQIFVSFHSNEYLIKAFNEVDNDGNTGLHYSVPNSECMVKILNLYLDLNDLLAAVSKQNNKGKSALHLAA